MSRAPTVARTFAALGVAAALLAGAAACGSDDGGGGGTPELSAAGRRGQQVARDNGCTACHSTDGSRMSGPTWKGLAGSTVELDDGSSVTADAAYLRRAVTDPGAEVVKGFPAIMPTAYDGLTDAQLDDLVAYLRDLGDT